MPVDKNLTSNPVTGSFTFGSTSYSGADIKAVVHIYDKNTTVLSQQITDTEDEIASLEQAVTSLRGNATELAEYNTRIANLKNDLAFLKRNRNEFGDVNITTKVLAELQTLSVSTYREKYPVRSLSSVYPKSFTRGPRTIGGSMVFTVFDKNVLFDILEADPTDFDIENISTSALIDQLPPLDITLVFANELGQSSRMAILGVEFVSEGQVMSIQDIFVENTVQYVARDIDPMSLSGKAKLDAGNIITGTEMAGTRGSDLLNTEAAKQFKQKVDPFSARFKLRNDPFK